MLSNVKYILVNLMSTRKLTVFVLTMALVHVSSFQNAAFANDDLGHFYDLTCKIKMTARPFTESLPGIGGKGKLEVCLDIGKMGSPPKIRLILTNHLGSPLVQNIVGTDNIKSYLSFLANKNNASIFSSKSPTNQIALNGSLVVIGLTVFGLLHAALPGIAGLALPGVIGGGITGYGCYKMIEGGACLFMRENFGKEFVGIVKSKLDQGQFVDIIVDDLGFFAENFTSVEFMRDFLGFHAFPPPPAY